MIFIIKSSLLTITLGFFMGCSGISNDTSNIDTLIITSNRHESIALAEHLQVRNEQLVLSIPANKADTTLYILGPEKDLLLETDLDKFSNFIRFTNPKNIIILGNHYYVDKSYIKQINPNIPVHIFNDKDWKLIAWQVEELTGFGGLAEDYISHLDELIRSKTIPNQFAPTSPTEPQALIPQN